MEVDIKILEEIIKGDKDCIEMISKFNSNNKGDDEDIKHYKREIKGITNIINSYKKEKARADKLEKEYSKMLTKIDEYEVNYIPVSLIEEKIEELKEEKIETIKNRNATDYVYFIEKLKTLDIQIGTLISLKLNPECKWIENSKVVKNY